MHGKGYGMPSSHAQFVAFFSISLTLFLLCRHTPGHPTSYSPSTFIERLLLSAVALLGAAAVAASRAYLSYHTPKQIWVGIAAGTVFAIVYFLFTTFLRRYGWIDWALDMRIARMLRFRDLITTEDLQDAGWGRYEARRKARRDVDAVTSRKSK
jgi:dolichyldiphosphatase